MHYDSRRLYSILHQRHVLIPNLNAKWVSTDKESRWIWRLHSVWYIRVSYKFRVFSWLVIYQGLPTKARLVKSVIYNGLCIVCEKEENVKHIQCGGGCTFAKSYWDNVQS